MFTNECALSLNRISAWFTYIRRESVRHRPLVCLLRSGLADAGVAPPGDVRPDRRPAAPHRRRPAPGAPLLHHHPGAQLRASTRPAGGRVPPAGAHTAAFPRRPAGGCRLYILHVDQFTKYFGSIFPLFCNFFFFSKFYFVFYEKIVFRYFCIFPLAVNFDCVCSDASFEHSFFG